MGRLPVVFVFMGIATLSSKEWVSAAGVGQKENHTVLTTFTTLWLLKKKVIVCACCNEILDTL